MTEERANKIYNQVLKLVEAKLSNTTTYQRDLLNFGKRVFGDKFVGVHASNEIPKLKEGDYAILNLDKSSEPGSHWIAVAMKNNNTHVYDSFGRDSKKIIPSVFKSGNGKILDADDDAEQEDSELNCGARSISFLLVFHIWGKDVAMLI